MGIKIRNVSRIKKIKTNLKDLSRYAIEVGIFSDSGSSKDGVSYLLIATVHEFGSY